MVWSRAKLEEVVGERLAQRAKLEPVEEAALAYARWQGLTDEAGVDIETAKATLDRALETLDDLGPAGWVGLKDLANALGDTAVIGLMQHSLKRGIDQIRDQASSLDSSADDTEAEAAPAATHRRGKGRNM